MKWPLQSAASKLGRERGEEILTKFWWRLPVKDNWYQISTNLHAKHIESSFVQMLSEIKDLDFFLFFFLRSWFFYFFVFVNVSCSWVSVASSYLKCALRVLELKWNQCKWDVINHCKTLAVLVRDRLWAIVNTLLGPYCFEIKLQLKMQKCLENLLRGKTWSW